MRDIQNETVERVPCSKATHVGDVPADMLKIALDIHLSLINKIINLSFENRCFQTT